ncbi:MAG: P-loop NTPase fold protein, partial [Saprospiraceae bacterium]|nr:P-loop NTPase fold protein [Saprospiraceae bacterium]
HLTGEGLPGQPDGKAKVAKGHYKHRVVTIWFEAWRYQHEAVPVVALIQEIRRQFPLAEKVKDKFAKTGEVTFRSVLNGLDDAAKLIGLEAVPFSAKRIQDIGEQWERDHLAQRLATDSLQEYLTKVIEQLLKTISTKSTPNVRLVVLIDDLDRCGSEAAYRLLEGLKIYLNLPNCVFVLGMNQQAVVDAIAQNLPGARDKNEGELRLRAEAYLEKLCSVIWRLPLPASPKKLLLEWIVEAPDLHTALDKALTGDTNGREIRCLPPNPRRLKALANLICRLHATGESVSNKNEARRLLVVAYVYQFHADLFHRWQYDPDFFNEMRAWLRGGESDPVKSKPYFKHLMLPISATTNPKEPEVQLIWNKAFPDSGACEVFWIAPLLIDETLKPTDFIPYLERGNV